MTALVLLMRLVKDEGSVKGDRDEYTFPHDTFTKIVKTLAHAEEGQEIREEFVKKYMDQYDDIRYYAFSTLAWVVSSVR